MNEVLSPRAGGVRGARSNPPGRFDRLVIEPDPEAAADEASTAPTEYFRDASRSLITANDSPDVPFSFNVNPYRGCEHGCAYCYARPYHEYLGLSAGLDFESKIFVKERAPEILRRELGRKSWTGEALAFSGVTDPYQPIERRLGITRRCLEVIAACRQPVGVITKNVLVVRDGDLLADLSRRGAAHVFITIPTLDERLRQVLEPRAPTPDARLDAVSRLKAAGVTVGVMVAPVIPGLTDHEIPRIVRRAGAAGASFADFTMLRLPGAVRGLFEAWLERHAPSRRTRVLRLLRQVHGGFVNDSCFGRRWRGEGPIADVVEQLFLAARRRARMAGHPPPLSSDGFRRPGRETPLLDALPD